VCLQHKPSMSQARSSWQHVCVCVQVDKVLEQLREDPRVSATGAKLSSAFQLVQALTRGWKLKVAVHFLVDLFRHQVRVQGCTLLHTGACY